MRRSLFGPEGALAAELQDMQAEASGHDAGEDGAEAAAVTVA